MGVGAARRVYRPKPSRSPFNGGSNPIGKPRVESYYEISEFVVVEDSIRYLGYLLPHAVQESQILEVGEYRYGSYRDIQFSCRVELDPALVLYDVVVSNSSGLPHG